MNKKMDKKLAEKAAKWWADQLRSPATLDHGDDSLTGMQVRVMATHLQGEERKRLDEGKIDKFEEELANLVIKEADGRTRRIVYIGVDYDPDWILQQAAEKAGVRLGMTTLPWKTTMWVDMEKGEVKVSEGYQGEVVAL